MSSSEEENFNIDVSDDESEEDYAPVVKKKATATATVSFSILATLGGQAHRSPDSMHRRTVRRLSRRRPRRNPQQSLRQRSKPLSQTRMTTLDRTRISCRMVVLAPPTAYNQYQKDPRRLPQRSTPRFEFPSSVLYTADRLPALTT